VDRISKRVVCRSIACFGQSGQDERCLTKVRFWPKAAVPPSIAGRRGQKIADCHKGPDTTHCRHWHSSVVHRYFQPNTSFYWRASRLASSRLKKNTAPINGQPKKSTLNNRLPAQETTRVSATAARPSNAQWCQFDRGGFAVYFNSGRKVSTWTRDQRNRT
jgi:hypothetical protein